MVGVVLLTSVFFFSTDTKDRKKTTYYDIVEMFRNDEIASYILNYSNGKLEYTKKDDPETKHSYSVPSVTLFVNDVHSYVIEYNKDNDSDADIIYDYEAGSSGEWLTSLLPLLISVVMVVILMFVMTKKMNQSITNETNRTLSFGKARIKKIGDDKKKTTFADVAGVDEEKEELAEIVDFLKDPTKYSDLGARIPKGVLLVGPPGTGKTLLARAVAGEANVPFLSISGSDFLEMYVGVGASRVRDLFDQAKKNAPSIIFIDEIDAVGRHRGAGMGGGHDEREQTLNQMLVEMDGFVTNSGVIVIAATNRPDILDPALLRPGRFDRQVMVGYPDLKGRLAILKVHARNKSIAPDVDLNDIARSTVGFTGADLENLLNEAALLAARRSLKAITMAEIDEATLKVIVGTEKKSHKISDDERKLTAFHEAGHALSQFFLGGQDPVHQVSIVPRGMAGGFTISRPVEDKSYNSKKKMEQQIVILLGGRVAEAIVLNDISTGASNDIERASEIARKMVTKYGMSEKLGPIAFGTGHDEVFLGKDYGTVRNYSENVAAVIDEEVNAIISGAYKTCEAILIENRAKLDELASYLMQYEKIDGAEFEKMMRGEEYAIPLLTESVTNDEVSEKTENNTTTEE
ncbi:MAG: ATP-dependent zinc metalloprotease FtsH [Clostridia bacterium]|nr:ATP-dependent zinc metalloprotease FtsH [Clostridia bacterium]MBR6780000.1 ATP-dependent zinc metalloprotease FtsH [Clostridia bacterium]